MIRFSLLHPSRGRLRLAEEAIAEWTGKASGAHPIEYILSVDADDDVDGYRALAARRGARLAANANRSVVEAVNRAATAATGDVLVVVSDDFGCPDRWDAEIAAVLGERRDAGVLVHDGLDARIMTLPILGRALYEQLGYVYHPAYFSLFCDDDLTHTIRGLGKLIEARHLVFPHRHWSVGAAPFDATYARQDSGAAWRSGLRTFEKRRAVEFGRRPRTPDVWARQLVIDLRYWTRFYGSRAKRAALGMIAQLLYDQVSIRGTSAWARRRRAWADRLRLTYIRRFGDTVVRYRRWDIQVRLSHNLALYEGLFPLYATAVPRIVSALAAKYPDLRCIDVGANVGDTAVQIRRAAAVPILCVEGNESFAALLDHNLSSLPETRVVRAYVAETDGCLPATVEERGGTARLAPSDGAPEIRVRTLAAILDDHPAFRAAKLLKIDTDGFDLRVIRGASAWIGNARPVLFFEYDPSLSGSRGADADAFFALLSRLGYRRALRYLNTGELDGVASLASGVAAELEARLSRAAADAYFDLCVFHDEDADVHERLAAEEGRPASSGDGA